GASLATRLLTTFVTLAAYFFILQYLELVLELSPLGAALWAVPSFGAFILGSILTPQLVRRVRRAYVISGGMAVAAIGYGILAQIDQASGLAMLVVGSVVASLGEAPAVTLATGLVVGAAPPQPAGMAAAISETSSELGGALGIAILGSLGAALYRRQIAEGIPDATLHDAADAARDTLGGTVAASDQLPASLAHQLLETARDVFIMGLRVAAL